MQPDRTAELTRLLRERILVMDGAMGTMIQQRKLSEADFRGCAARPHARPQGRQRSAGADAARCRARDPRRVPRRGRRHHRDQHVHGDRASRKPTTACRPVRTTSTTRPRRSRARCADAWTARTPDKPRFVAGAMGPTNRTASISPDGQRPGRAQRDLRRARGDLWRGGGGARGRRRRLDPGRDDLRHAERQGGAVRDRVVFRASGAALAAHRVGHHHRRLGPHALRPDARRRSGTRSVT